MSTISGVTGPIPRFSGLSDETVNRGPSSYDLGVGGRLNPSSFTH